MIFLDKLENEKTIQIAKDFIALGENSLESIAKATSLSLEKVQELAKELAA